MMESDDENERSPPARMEQTNPPLGPGSEGTAAARPPGGLHAGMPSSHKVMERPPSAPEVQAGGRPEAHRTATSPRCPTKKAGPRGRARAPKGPLRDEWRRRRAGSPRRSLLQMLPHRCIVVARQPPEANQLTTIWRQKPVRTSWQCDPPPSNVRRPRSATTGLRHRPRLTPASRTRPHHDQRAIGPPLHPGTLPNGTGMLLMRLATRPRRAELGGLRHADPGSCSPTAPHIGITCSAVSR